MHDLLRDWMLPRRAFWLANAGGPMGVNPDQRMHEDARKLCELSADLGTGLLQAAILFGIFAGVLWVLSQRFLVPHRRDAITRSPASWCGPPCCMRALGSLAQLLGRAAASSAATRSATRAKRTCVSPWCASTSTWMASRSPRGEEDERRRVEMHLGNVLAATRAWSAGLTNLTWVTAGFGWITIVAPILVAAPLYFAGKISFGGLMMAAAAFTQAQSSLRWFVDNFSTIADWRRPCTGSRASATP